MSRPTKPDETKRYERFSFWLSMTALITPAKDLDRNLALQKATITAYKNNSSRTSAQQISANSQTNITLFINDSAQGLLSQNILYTPAQLCLLKKLPCLKNFKYNLLRTVDNSLCYKAIPL